LAARVFIWITTDGGAWAIAANWDDLTDSISPSLVVPGSLDSVAVTGPSGNSAYALTGNATLATAQFAGDVMLSGNVIATTLTAGLAAAGGVLQLTAGSSLQSSSATLAGGSVLVNGTNTQFGVAGQLTMGTALAGGYPAASDLSVTAGGHASVLAVLMRTANSQIYVDPSSIMEIGTLTTGAKGKLTVDTGFILLGQGSANQYGSLVDNGNIYAFGGTLAVGTVTGSGHLGISANATMLLDGPTSAGEQVIFAGGNTTLEIAAEAYSPLGTITGFATGDAIDYRGSPISAAVYNASSSTVGVLTLYYGTAVAAQLTLAGNYSASTFLTAGDGSNGTLIEVAPAVSGSNTASTGTSTPDIYAWTAIGSGAWGLAANWQDQTSGASPAAIAPGAANIVDIAVAQNAFTVIAGPANAASLSLNGEAALTGTFAIGTLSIGTVSGAGFTNGGLDLLAGAVIRSNAATVQAGAISAAGAGALLSVAGTLSMGGGITGVGLPVTALSATAGGRIRAGALIIGGGSGNSITTDPSGSVEIGTLANAGVGSVTVDAGAAITGNGSINPFGAVVDNGTITASGGLLVLGSVTGTGQLAIGNGALELTYATALPIAFTSTASTLAIGGPAAIPTGALTGIVPGDVIDLLGSPLSGVQYVAGATASAAGTLALIYNGVTIGKLSAGPFPKISFVATPDGQTGTDIGFLVGSGGSGAAGQTGTDPLVWTGAANGNWSIAVNWNDTVTGKAATLPPGTQTTTVITGGSGATFQSISGTGTCASLVLNGNGFFFGSFTAGSLSVGQDSSSSATATAGTLVTTVLTTFTLGSCLVADGAFLVAGTKSLVDVAGTLAVSDNGLASVLSISQKAAAQAGALSLAGGSVSVDAYSSLEVGTLGGAATGLLTIDPGAMASGYGTLDQLGTLAVNGTVSAAGGTLLLGPASGTGTLVIGTEAALGLTAATSVPIAMAGAGATLILRGINARAAGVISGFAPGDSIVTSNTPIDSVSYQPGTGNLGVLTLSEAGQSIETLILAGNYAGESFSVQPDGSGAAVIVSGSGTGTGGTGSGPPVGTVTPDQYVWTGADGVLWADAKNWIDSSSSPKIAASLAPGQNDLVTIAVPSGGAEQVTGPANAASLTATGSLALVGTYGIGTLAVGTAQLSGVLAMGNGTSITTAGAKIIGGIAGFGGQLVVGGTLTLGQGSLAGLVSANGATAISADFILMQGVGSALLTDTSATVEVGGIATAAAGSVSIDAAGTISGAGVINPNGVLADNGMVTASGGTLTLGAVSGGGTLLVGVAASMVIEGAVASGLTVDFAAGGTLTLPDAAGFAGGIADFGPGDQILLPMSGATAAEYVLTGPGLGQLTIYAGNQVLTRLTLLGSQADYVFSVAGSAGGGTILTATPSNMAGGGGSIMGNYPSISGGFVISPTTLYALAPADSYRYLLALNGGPTNTNPNDYEYFLAGETTVVGPALYSTIGELGVDVEVIGPLSGEVAPGGFGPGSNVVLQAGYNALIAEGTNAINLFDQNLGDSLLVSNEGADNLVTGADNDTLVGAAGGNTVFFASGAENVTIQGGGNDTINSTDNSQITTSSGQSDVFLGGAANNVVSFGADAILAGTVGIADDTVTDNAAAGSAGDTVFGPSFGSLFYNGGASPGTVVGGGGQIVVNGGSAENVIWAGNSFVQYNGGPGPVAIAGGTQGLFVQGGTGPETVFGGTGTSVILGSPGNSIYVMGLGPATIAAAAGNTVWVTGSAQVSVTGAAGVVVYAGLSSAGHLLQATAGPETLCGGAGNDTFYAGSGTGIFVSDGGADMFNFLDGQTGGTDQIFGFVPGLDTLGLQGYGFSVPQLNVVNGSTYFTLSDGTNVELYNVTNLSSGSFNIS
jgi:fibronectin-binding autotransporter adhesin